MLSSDFFFIIIIFCYYLHTRLLVLLVVFKLVNHLPFVYFKIQIFGAVIVFSFSIALALRKANFVGRNIGH